MFRPQDRPLFVDAGICGVGDLQGEGSTAYAAAARAVSPYGWVFRCLQRGMLGLKNLLKRSENDGWVYEWQTTIDLPQDSHRGFQKITANPLLVCAEVGTWSDMECRCDRSQNKSMVEGQHLGTRTYNTNIFGHDELSSILFFKILKSLNNLSSCWRVSLLKVSLINPQGLVWHPFSAFCKNEISWGDKVRFWRAIV